MSVMVSQITGLLNSLFRVITSNVPTLALLASFGANPPVTVDNVFMKTYSFHRQTILIRFNSFDTLLIHFKNDTLFQENALEIVVFIMAVIFCNSQT